ncbi:acetyl-CoA acetyltransferase domain protein [Mycobacteroides abscessus subsp. massiliense CCUG 48898 = JCM 15300]|nr:acetyl-CoA acetyltransferase domain protein [Mycobacteroides abscessus subsp. massiliense CCUG 48898 = JCM 15300]
MQRGPPADAWSFRVGIRLRKRDVLNQLWIDTTLPHNRFDDIRGKILGS